MRRRRVVVIYVHPLFGRGVAQLLRADKQLDVSCLWASLAGASEELKRLRPHAIVVEGYEEGNLLREVVRDLPSALFVRIHLEDNAMDVYQGRQVVTARPENLVEAVRLGLNKPGRAGHVARLR